ncbi:MAG: aspartyl protease family protein [Bacteroidetes bacterium]|nr:aspartyl protease family protein [Bacteroidota bacterium]
MRNLLLSLFLAIPFLLSAEFPSDTKMKTHVEKNDFFGFMLAYEKDSASLGQEDHYYFGAYYHSWFGNAATSNYFIDQLLNQKEFHPDDSLASQLVLLHFGNSLRLFNYAQAAKDAVVIETKYANVIDTTTMEDIRNGDGMVKALADVAPQEMIRNGDLDMMYTRDLAGLLRINVELNGVKGKFIVDSGANLSTISESEAARMHVKILDASFGVTSSSKKNVGAELGVADELKFGNVTFHHVVFIVMPDKNLRFAGGLYKIKGIVGFPVIAQLGEIQIKKNGHIFSPYTLTTSSFHNLGMNGNTPFVNMKIFGEEHAYIFDTGAAATIFDGNFQNHYSDSLKNVKEGKSAVGGAGGVQKVSILLLTHVRYHIGTAGNELKRASVQTSGVVEAFEDYYGIVGEDIFSQWDTMTISFTNHFVDFN